MSETEPSKAPKATTATTGAEDRVLAEIRAQAAAARDTPVMETRPSRRGGMASVYAAVTRARQEANPQPLDHPINDPARLRALGLGGEHTPDTPGRPVANEPLSTWTQDDRAALDDLRQSLRTRLHI
ncbi:hypothetical protein [Cellulomonas sp. Leaf334]|uniref:hypothetical protein n=1 Tax=Cellulomonas sp. Leaf334 TaxID=1736339 RepID=UPI0006FC6574|nr:hypothetical protein [Cellulomonas sp. Leaf334]KQR17264.1 hypothetical protein ASF78_08190 [Cellulomonas sp. Leaf334]